MTQSSCSQGRFDLNEDTYHFHAIQLIVDHKKMIEKSQECYYNTEDQHKSSSRKLRKGFPETLGSTPGLEGYIGVSRGSRSRRKDIPSSKNRICKSPEANSSPRSV